MSDSVKETQFEKACEIKGTYLWDCRRHKSVTIENDKEHIEQCLGEILNSYIEDERNYVVNEAIISCNQMGDKEFYIQFKREETILD